MNSMYLQRTPQEIEHRVDTMIEHYGAYCYVMDEYEFLYQVNYFTEDIEYALDYIQDRMSLELNAKQSAILMTLESFARIALAQRAA